MISLFYGCTFAVSILFSGVYFYMWHKHFDVNPTLVFTLVPVACVGYMLTGRSGNLGEYVQGIKIVYLGGCYLQLFMLFTVFNLCGIELHKILKMILYFVCTVIYASVLTIGNSDLFYKSAVFEMKDGAPVVTKEYGIMHTAFLVVVVLFFAAGIIAIAYSFFKKKQVPRTVISLLILPDVITIFCYFSGRFITDRVEIVPLGYVLAQFIYILIAYRVNLYDVADTVIDSMVQERAIGYISFDFDYRYLGSNETARQIVPELSGLAVDEIFGYKPAERKIRHFLDIFKKNRNNNLFVYNLKDPEGDTEKDKVYNVNINYLYDGSRRRGYIVTFTDDTQNRKYIRLLDHYNEKLKEEVGDKTRHIIEMHDNLIMSLAMMVESRDNSTGGHIKRTSEGVRILTEEIQKEGKLALSKEFIRDVVKAAPMHDLGKIAVDDAVLRKPGRFTDEEFEKMKNHAEEGARVIHEILLNTDDGSFKKVAENVAHYHHERWDGSGYPDGLKGESIPVEARIMAIADVYDALVSKRVYKEAFDFEKANNIIMEGMGTQFDPGLKEAYENARPRLEEYYKTM